MNRTIMQELARSLSADQAIGEARAFLFEAAYSIHITRDMCRVQFEASHETLNRMARIGAESNAGVMIDSEGYAYLDEPMSNEEQPYNIRYVGA